MSHVYRYRGLMCLSDHRIFDVVAAVTDSILVCLLVDVPEGGVVVVVVVAAAVTEEVDIGGTNWKLCPILHAVVIEIDAEM